MSSNNNASRKDPYQLPPKQQRAAGNRDAWPNTESKGVTNQFTSAQKKELDKKMFMSKPNRIISNSLANDTFANSCAPREARDPKATDPK